MTPSNPDDARYTLAELSDLAGVTQRTVRYYLSQGLLPAVGVTGPGAKYDDGHLARLRLIKGLQSQHLPLAEIRNRLERLDDRTVLTLTDELPEVPPDSALDYLRRVRADSGPPTAASEVPGVYRATPLLSRTVVGLGVDVNAEPSVPPMPARDPGTKRVAEPPAPYQSTRSQWERISLAPDVELHVRRPLARPTAKRVDRLIEIARDLLEEDLP